MIEPRSDSNQPLLQSGINLKYKYIVMVITATKVNAIDIPYPFHSILHYPCGGYAPLGPIASPL